jgi:ATP-dependent DNA helicase RecQ
LPDELAARAGLSRETLNGVFHRMVEQKEAEYIPPFRGRGLRILKRMRPENLDIDFQALQVRRANDLEKLERMIAYATTRTCRRGFLLNYFGDQSTSGYCGACDLCKGKRRPPAAGEENADPVLAVKILSGVARLNGRFGRKVIAQMLAGSQDSTLSQLGLDSLTTYGLLSAYSQSQILEWMTELITRDCIAARAIRENDGSREVLEITGRGRDIMQGKARLGLSAPRKKRMSESPKNCEASESDIFNRLRVVRSSLARKEKLAPYCIFQDRTLKEMARSLPTSPEQLLDIVGVGRVTLRKYGDAFLAVLQRIRDEKGHSP